MRVAVDSDRFSAQRERYSFRFCCEHCAYFIARRESCAHGWPTGDHRLAHYSDRIEQVVFCKEFELR